MADNFDLETLLSTILLQKPKKVVDTGQTKSSVQHPIDTGKTKVTAKPPPFSEIDFEPSLFHVIKSPKGFREAEEDIRERMKQGLIHDVTADWIKTPVELLVEEYRDAQAEADELVSRPTQQVKQILDLQKKIKKETNGAKRALLAAKLEDVKKMPLLKKEAAEATQRAAALREKLTKALETEKIKRQEEAAVAPPIDTGQTEITASKPSAEETEFNPALFHVIKSPEGFREAEEDIRERKKQGLIEDIHADWIRTPLELLAQDYKEAKAEADELVPLPTQQVNQILDLQKKIKEEKNGVKRALLAAKLEDVKKMPLHREKAAAAAKRAKLLREKLEKAYAEEKAKSQRATQQFQKDEQERLKYRRRSLGLDKR